MQRFACSKIVVKVLRAVVLMLTIIIIVVIKSH